MPGHLNSANSIGCEISGQPHVQHFHYVFSEECPAGWSPGVKH